MFLCAKTINNKLKPLSNDLANMVYKYLSINTEIKITENRRKDIIQVCNCFIYNSLKHIMFGDNCVSVSLTKSDYSTQPVINGVKSKCKPVSYRYMRVLFDCLISHGCSLEVGGYAGYNREKDKVYGEYSTLILSDEVFYMFYNEIIKIKFIPKRESVLEIRDKEKKPIQFKSTEQTKRIVEDMNLYNEEAMNHDVTDQNGNSLYIQGYRIFNRDLIHGGRIYYERGVVQSLPSSERAKILINGEQVTEVDFKALHPSICAVHQGVKFEDGFDPYAIEMEGYDLKLLRKLAKLCLLVRINCSDDNQFIKAFNKIIASDFDIDLLYENKLIPEPIIEPRKILNAVLDSNLYLMDKLNDVSGTLLQAVDSAIAVRIINYFSQRNILAISVHDSFIVQKKYQDTLINVMKWAYESQLGTSDNCQVDIKY